MAHATSRGAYRQLTERLNRLPQGAPPSELLYRIVEMLFSDGEARLVAQLPIKPFTAKKAARIYNRALFSHRAMAASLGVILRLPPTKQILATEQMRSRYLVRLLQHVTV